MRTTIAFKFGGTSRSPSLLDLLSIHFIHLRLEVSHWTTPTLRVHTLSNRLKLKYEDFSSFTRRLHVAFYIRALSTHGSSNVIWKGLPETGCCVTNEPIPPSATVKLRTTFATAVITLQGQSPKIGNMGSMKDEVKQARTRFCRGVMDIACVISSRHVTGIKSRHESWLDRIMDGQSQNAYTAQILLSYLLRGNFTI